MKGVRRYPQAGSPRLRQALASHHGIPKAQIVAGKGSDEIIDLIIQVAVESGRDRVVAFLPRLNIYQFQSKLCDVAFRQIALREISPFPC
ncbi:MAG: aminotransferase class I/II-fold pyridoxal phosphate-dependent enzyme [Deltaproteobacteria bacterium]|nr:aminotransferase class I/II-fold pyridoxal phosphate-dependent enzyme [Deltaproteobacteria bacterium]